MDEQLLRCLHHPLTLLPPPPMLPLATPVPKYSSPSPRLLHPSPPSSPRELPAPQGVLCITLVAAEHLPTLHQGEQVRWSSPTLHQGTCGPHAVLEVTVDSRVLRFRWVVEATSTLAQDPGCRELTQP